MRHAGGKILLNKATLHLKRGRRYGLCGPNGAGKVGLAATVGRHRQCANTFASTISVARVYPAVRLPGDDLL